MAEVLFKCAEIISVMQQLPLFVFLFSVKKITQYGRAITFLKKQKSPQIYKSTGIRTFSLGIDAGSSALLLGAEPVKVPFTAPIPEATTGSKLHVEVPFNCEVDAWTTVFG